MKKKKVKGEKEIEKRIVVKKKKVGGKDVITYNNFSEKSSCLKKLFDTQGQLYNEVLGVSLADADLAGWHPEDRDFDPHYCNGWKTFLDSKGKITKEREPEILSVLDFIFPPPFRL